MTEGNGHWTDWIEDFLAYTEGMSSPEVYRLWSGISCLAGALERRVWLRAVEHFETFPNLYVICVGAPGVGKQVIDLVKELWGEVPDPGSDSRPLLHVAPDSVSKASLMDSIVRAKRTFLPPSGPPLVYHSLLIAAEEFEFFLPSYDKEFISALNKMFNNPAKHLEVRRTGSVRELELSFPQLNILAGAQPAYFASTFPEEAWNTGLARRIILIYAAETPFVPLFQEREDRSWLRQKLIRGLGRAGQLWGQMKWEPAAGAYITEWDRGGGPPQPKHSKLQHYLRSRTMHALKLSMIAAISRGMELVIKLEDVERGIGWLLNAEKFMPDIFREMIGKSDSQVVEELHYMVQAWQARNRGKCAPRQFLVEFLHKRVPSEKIEKILWVAKEAGMVVPLAGTEEQLWQARVRYEYGVE